VPWGNMSVFEICARLLLKNEDLSPNECKSLDKTLWDRLDKVDVEEARAVDAALQLFAFEGKDLARGDEWPFETTTIRRFLHCISSRGHIWDVKGRIKGDTSPVPALT
jgi:hypothetical protein